MALAPKFAGQKFAAGGSSSQAVHTLEFYLDYVCPYSKKQFNTLYTSVFPLIEKKYAKNVQVIFRQQVQPWHPSSTLVHEAALAVLKTDASKFWQFSAEVFAQQDKFFDVSVVNETRNAVYRRLAKLAAAVGVDEDKVYRLLEIGDKAGADGSLNVGNGVTVDLKAIVRQARLVGIHVSPTVLFDGLVENNISSSFTVEQWDEWMQKNVV